MELIEKFKLVSEGHSVQKPGCLEDDKPYPILEVLETQLMDDFAMTEIQLQMDIVDDDDDDDVDNVDVDNVDAKGKYTMCLHPAYRRVIKPDDMSEINRNPGKFKLIHRKKGSCSTCYELAIVT
jgi:hypothetical protein